MHKLSSGKATENKLYKSNFLGPHCGKQQKSENLILNHEIHYTLKSEQINVPDEVLVR